MKNTNTNATAAAFKSAYNAYKSASAICDTAEAAMIEDPESEAKEAAFDAAYNDQHAAYTEAVNILVSICAPFVPGFTAKTARAMLAKNEAEITSLVNRLAA